MLKCTLTRILPFTLTFVLGASLGGLVQTFVTRDAESGRVINAPSRSCDAFFAPVRSASEEAEGVFSSKDVDRKAMIALKPAPVYTIEARRNGVEGVVRLRAVLRASGEVTDIEVLKGLPEGLTEQAVKAARLIDFEPARKDGRAASQRVVLEYNFNIY